jgi:hypothetical protein
MMIGDDLIAETDTDDETMKIFLLCDVVNF